MSAGSSNSTAIGEKLSLQITYANYSSLKASVRYLKKQDHWYANYIGGIDRDVRNLLRSVSSLHERSQFLEEANKKLTRFVEESTKLQIQALKDLQTHSTVSNDPIDSLEELFRKLRIGH